MTKLPMNFKCGIFVLLLQILGSASAVSSYAKINSKEIVQKTAETQIRHLLEPLLDKYCHDDCKLMNIQVNVDLMNSDSISPGFEDTDLRKESELVPSTAQVKLLVDDRVGPTSRDKLLTFIQQNLDTLDYPVKVESQVAHFPIPQGSEGKITELRQRITKQFQDTSNELLHKFCPQQSILADFNLQTDLVNSEEAQYGPSGEFLQEGDATIRIKEISATLLMDQTLSPEEQSNMLEMLKLKTNSFKHVAITGKSIKFPKPLTESGESQRDPASTRGGSKTSSNNSSNNNNSETNTKQDSNTKQEKFERIEKIERVESGDAIQTELQKFKIYGLIFSASIFALLIFIALSAFRRPTAMNSSGIIPTSVHKVIQSLTSDPVSNTTETKSQEANSTTTNASQTLSHRYEVERLTEELAAIYAQQPRVAKQVFSRILTEEGVETTAACIHVFGEGIVIDMLRDPTLQSDLNELMEYYAKNPIDLNDNQKLDLLRRLHARTIAGKLVVFGNRSSTLFDFLGDMDAQQIIELISNESLTVKSIVLTQCNPQKRTQIYSQMPADSRVNLLNELSRIDYLPKDFVYNVATALKKRKRDNPKLNTEALPGSEVLISLLERTSQTMQKSVVKALETSNPDSARAIKSKLVSIDTLKFLREGQLLEVVLSLKHEELIQFLKGAPDEVRASIFVKAPKELVQELEEEIAQTGLLSQETYHANERKILNRIKVMAHDGHINLLETNGRMFSDSVESGFIQTSPGVLDTERKAVG